MFDLSSVLSAEPARVVVVIVPHESQGHQPPPEHWWVEKTTRHGITIVFELRRHTSEERRELRIAESMQCGEIFCGEAGNNIVALPVDREGTSLLFLMTEDQHHRAKSDTNFLQLARQAIESHPALAKTFEPARPFATA